MKKNSASAIPLKNDYSSNVAIEISGTKFGTEEKSLLGEKGIPIDLPIEIPGAKRKTQPIFEFFFSKC